MHYNTIKIKIEKGVGMITLNRPEKRNAINNEMINELSSTLLKLAQNQEIKMLTIEGSPPGFSAGRDINDLKKLEEESPFVVREEFNKIKQLSILFLTFPLPILAIVRGFAYGAGCSIITWCDLAIAEEKTKLGYPGVGLVPGLPATILSHTLSRKKLNELFLLGQIWDAFQAESVGIVNWVVSEGAMEEESSKLIEKLIDKDRRVLRALKEFLGRTQNPGLNTDLESSVDVMTLSLLQRRVKQKA